MVAALVGMATGIEVTPRAGWNATGVMVDTGMWKGGIGAAVVGAVKDINFCAIM